MQRDSVDVEPCAFRIDAINGNRSHVPAPPRSGGEGGRRPDEEADRLIVKRS